MNHMQDRFFDRFKDRFQNRFRDRLKRINVLALALLLSVSVPAAALASGTENASASEPGIVTTSETENASASESGIVTTTGTQSTAASVQIAADEVHYADGEAVETLDDAREAMAYADEILDETGTYDEDGTCYQLGRLLVKTDEDISDSCGADTAVYYESLGMYILEYGSAEETEAAEIILQEEFGTDAVFSDQYMCADSLSTSLTDGGSVSWGTDYMNLNTLRDSAEEDETLTRKVTVAVLDTGINTSHEIFSGRKILKDSVNLVNLNKVTADIEDDCGHGSHVAGIIANSTSSNIRFLSLKILNENGEGSVLTLAIGIDYINTYCDYVDVINISAGVDGVEEGSPVYEELEALLKKAYRKGMFIVAASGNGDLSGNGSDIARSGTYPANSAYAIAVGAVNSGGKRADFSNYGSALDFVAPGVNIKSAYIGGKKKYVKSSGTSMAAPFMTAAVAMIYLYHPKWSQERVLKKLNNLAVDLGDEGTDIYYGAGAVVMSDLKSQKIKIKKKKYTVNHKRKKSFKLKASASTKLTYKSSDTSVVKVSKSGKVRVIGKGRATITIRAKSTLEYSSAVKKVKVVVK